MSTDALAIYDEVFARVSTLPGFKTVKKTPMFTVEPGDLPRLGVYILREQAAAEGDTYAGNPRFNHTLTLGYSASVAQSDDELLLVNLDTITNQILPALLSDPSFTKLVGFVSLDRKLVFTRVGETPLAELQIEMVLDFRTEWAPRVPDDLTTVIVTEQHAPGQAPPIIRQYDIETGRESHDDENSARPAAQGQRPQAHQASADPRRFQR